MKLDYNIYLELAAFPIDVIICVYLFLRYKEKTRVNLSFRRMAVFFTLTDGFDVVTAIASSAYTKIPNGLHLFFNTLDCCLAVFASFFFTCYVYTIVDDGHNGAADEGKKGPESRRIRIRDIVNIVILITDLLLLLQNLFTGNVFSYDAAGRYVHGPLFVLVAYLFSLYFMVNGCVFLLLRHRRLKRTQLISLAVGGSFVIAFFLLQMLFFDDWLITFYVASLGLIVMLFTLETPDYPELKRTIEQLDQSKKVAEDAKRQALEANSAKSRFLTQASHEIRTPLNAILGYNDLVLKESGDKTVQEHAKKVRSSAERLWKFFTELLNFVDSENRSSSGTVRQIAPVNGFLEPGTEIGPDRTVKGSVLVVDDNEMNIDLMVHFIGKNVAEVVTAKNGAEAIAAVKECHFDLIFMDNMMPVMDGITAFRKMREEGLCNDTPVVIVTANALASDRDHFLAEGFDAFLAKPFTQNDVQMLLGRYIKGGSDDADTKNTEEERTGLAAYGSQERLKRAVQAFDENADKTAERIEQEIMGGDAENAGLMIYAVSVTAEKLELEDLRIKAEAAAEVRAGELSGEVKALLKALRDRKKGAEDAV